MRFRYASILALNFILLASTRAAMAQAQPPTAESLRLAVYNYDSSLALQPELKLLPDRLESQSALRTRWHLAYDSVHDQRVTAILTIPKKFAAPFPAVILLAGSGGHKDTDYVRIASDLMSTLGYATLSIDAQYHGERSRPGRSGDIHLINSSTNRDAWIQTVIDLRRAVDYLQSRDDIDKSKIGYLGFSQGGMIGGTFIGVEPRIVAACLAIPGGGFLEWGPKVGLWKETTPELEANAALTDPIYFIGRFGSRPLLMLSAKRDELIPKYATDALFSAAKDPKEIVWFDSGHVLPPTALITNVKGFFAKHLGKRKGDDER
jgi:dienelactone hydrolase